MSVGISWLQPVAFWGLVALAVPIALHLMARQRRRRVPFPTLRFLRMTPVASLRRRVITEWFLLAVRVLIVTTSVGALAWPVIHVDDLQASPDPLRAVVVLAGGEPSPAIEEAVAGAQVEPEGIFRTNGLAAGLREAVRWIESRPHGGAEVAVVGRLRLGDVRADDLAEVPAAIGLRFVPVEAPQPTSTTVIGTVAARDALRTYSARVASIDASTEVRTGPGEATRAEQVSVRAPAPHQLIAEAALAAVFADGALRSAAPAGPITIWFDGATAADPEPLAAADLAWMRDTLSRLGDLAGARQGPRLIVHAGCAATDPVAPAVIRRVVHAAYAPSFDLIESLPMAAETLQGWTRSPTAARHRPAPQDSGHRRWLWSAVIALLTAEWWWAARVRARRSGAAAARPSASEVRVA